jgi:hypothetical protein
MEREPPPVYEPPPPPEPPRSKRSIPEMSIRVDPFNLLIDGKLGIELEAAVLKWMSVELVPIFVVNDTPPTFNYFTGPQGLKRESNGWGPLAGTSLDVGFWLQGKAMEGNVLRLILTNYSYKYTAPLDSVSHVERQLFGYFGSHDRFGAFTIAFGFGLGGELHPQRRCYVANSDRTYSPSEQCETNALLLRTDKVNARGLVPNTVDLGGGLGNIQVLGRISLGVVF